MKHISRIALLVVALFAQPTYAAEPLVDMSDYMCVPAGHWVNSSNGESLNIESVIPEGKGVLIAGESHTSMPTHLWQYHLIVEAYNKNPNMVITMESFPRSAQPVLDKWVAGEYPTIESFAEAVKWDEVWGFDIALYEPILRFAQQNAIPIKGMNVDKALTKSLGKNGWVDTPPGMLEGISKPAMISADYIHYLGMLYQMHQYNPEENPEHPMLTNFILSQLVWDRSFADVIAENYNEGKLVVAIVGIGHVQYGWGIEAQLRAIGIEGGILKLTAWQFGTSCKDYFDDMTDIYYGV